MDDLRTLRPIWMDNSQWASRSAPMRTRRNVMGESDIIKIKYRKMCSHAANSPAYSILHNCFVKPPREQQQQQLQQLTERPSRACKGSGASAAPLSVYWGEAGKRPRRMFNEGMACYVAALMQALCGKQAYWEPGS